MSNSLNAGELDWTHLELFRQRPLQDLTLVGERAGSASPLDPKDPTGGGLGATTSYPAHAGLFHGCCSGRVWQSGREAPQARGAGPDMRHTP